jgi:hypothetical protein
MVMSLSEWQERPEALSTAWQVHLKGDEVVAVAVDVGSGEGMNEPDEDPDFNPVFKLKKPRKKRAS